VAGGIVLPAVLRLSRRGNKLSSVLTLGGVFLLKWAMTYGGHAAALEPEGTQFPARRSSGADDRCASSAVFARPGQTT